MPSNEAVATPALPNGTCRGKRILIADDNEDAANSLGTVLQMLGNEIRVTYDGMQAVEAAETFHPDIVLLDIGMPKLNGYDAALRIRNQAVSRDALFIAITGWGQPEDKQRAFAAGFDHHLTKPVDPMMLVGLLSSA